MTSPDDLKHLIDRCAFQSVKAALFNHDDVQSVVFVRPGCSLEQVAAFCVDGSKHALDQLKADGDIVVLSPAKTTARTSVDRGSYLLDSDYVEVLRVPPIYLVRAKAHAQSTETSIAVRGITGCKQCGSLCGTNSASQYWNPPWNYLAGVDEYCLDCWLDCGPDEERFDHYCIEPTDDLLSDYESLFNLGYHLAILPVARMELSSAPIGFPGMISFHPVGAVDLDSLEISPNPENTPCLAERLSHASGIDEEVFARHPLIVLPCRFDWSDFRNSSYRAQLEFIRSLSEIVDDECFNFIRYRQCPIEPVHALPGRAGQTNSNHMMAGALLYSRENGGRIIGGDAFSHIVTRGLGLRIESINGDEFPKQGEVGKLVNHALSMYSHLIETNSSTAKFVQCLTLLEFLASLEEPGKFKPFKNTKKFVVRYSTTDPTEYQRIMERMVELNGMKDETGQNVGYRTQIVHFGKRLESLVPNLDERQELFQELEGYIRAVIDHLIEHSEKSWDDYKLIRDSLGPYGKAPEPAPPPTESAPPTTDDTPF